VIIGPKLEIDLLQAMGINKEKLIIIGPPAYNEKAGKGNR
jgi:hypothetical protein